MSPVTALIGIDCATQPRKVGLALGYTTPEGVRVVECCTGSRADPPAAIVERWLSLPGEARDEAVSPLAILALDAPLGWARPLGESLAGHRAGQPMGHDANALFRRRTDTDIRRRYGKRPLEVGANLISRTAVAALQLLEDLRRRTGRPIPLARDADDRPPISAIEVYPAVTRRSRQVPDRGGSLDGLAGSIELEAGVSPVDCTADMIDAMVCVLAAADFITGRCVKPADVELAEIEGWIWAP